MYALLCIGRREWIFKICARASSIRYGNSIFLSGSHFAAGPDQAHPGGWWPRLLIWRVGQTRRWSSSSSMVRCTSRPPPFRPPRFHQWRQLISENYCASALLAFSACRSGTSRLSGTISDEHLHELRSDELEEHGVCMLGTGTCQERLARTRRAPEQDSL